MPETPRPDNTKEQATLPVSKITAKEYEDAVMQRAHGLLAGFPKGEYGRAVTHTLVTPEQAIRYRINGGEGYITPSLPEGSQFSRASIDELIKLADPKKAAKEPSKTEVLSAEGEVRGQREWRMSLDGKRPATFFYDVGGDCVTIDRADHFPIAFSGVDGSNFLNKKLDTFVIIEETHGDLTTSYQIRIAGNYTFITIEAEGVYGVPTPGTFRPVTYAFDRKGKGLSEGLGELRHVPDDILRTLAGLQG